MPKVNGFEVLAWLEMRPEFSSLPTVVLSSSVFQGDSQKALDLGAREFLTKPYDMEELVTLAEGLHERWLAGEETMAAAVASVADELVRARHGTGTRTLRVVLGSRPAQAPQ